MSLVLDGTGSITGLTTTGISAVQQLPSGSVLQVVSTTITSQQTFGGGTSDVSGLSATITPKFSTSKVLVVVNFSFSTTSNADASFATLRGGSVIPSGVTGSVLNSSTASPSPYTNGFFSLAQSYLDSPATTSATTYKITVTTNTGTLYVNRRPLDTNFTGQSTITLLEIAA